MLSSLPSLAVSARKVARGRRRLLIVCALLVALGLFLFLNRDSFLFDPALSWDAVLSSVREYGYWLFSLYLVFTAAVLFLENRNPDRTLAWLLALALLPVIGLVLYWVVGPNFRYLADKRRFRLPRPCEVPEAIPAYQSLPFVRDTIQLVHRTSGAGLVTGKDLLPLYDGATAFARITERLANAQRGILLESYIIADDRTGNAVKDILIDRARHGVTVCVIYDAVGSWRIGKRYLRDLREGGVHAFPFLPVAFPMFRGANYRNHRKIIVVDGETAFVGGMNIGDEYAGIDARYTTWRDAHLALGGQGVEALRDICLGDLAWCGAPNELIARVRDATGVPASTGPTLAEGETPMQIIASGPDTPWDTIQKAYFSLITRARERIWLTSPYVVPGGVILEALSTASLSGVDVRLLVPGKADSLLVHWANRDCFDELLRAGIRIFLYDPAGFVHAKTVTCDSAVLSIGTANLDARSLRINFEVQAFLYDTQLAKQAEQAFENDMRQSLELTFETWQKRPKLEKVKESIGKLFSSLL